jgi:hypothetical protein
MRQIAKAAANNSLLPLVECVNSCASSYLFWITVRLREVYAPSRGMFRPRPDDWFGSNPEFTAPQQQRPVPLN